VTEPLLRVEQLTKRFGGLLAVDCLTFDVDHGETCAVIGPNGAGKSTLFNIIAGEQKPNAGTVLLEGDDITGLPDYRVARRGIGRAFQLVHLFGSMSVADNVLLGAEDHRRLRIISAATHLGGHRRRMQMARARVEEALSLVGIKHLAHSAIGSLSLGQQRLVGAARALASLPRLLLLDEPAAGLSHGELDVLRAAILRMRSARTSVLIVEHNVEFVLSFCDRVVVMNFGRKIAEGRPDEIRHSEAVIEAYLGRKH
jgi:ABC-type branched-subunit amino acid transport system ATPase component